ncbi:MAG: hypothetical protein KUL78_00555, partial [Flavobacterium sp.]|nr:hypothetical protein [Flavobacterium sp.]
MPAESPVGLSRVHARANICEPRTTASRRTLPTIIKRKKMAIDKLFELLDDWRFLPAYQLERRADIFFALHLEKIIEKKFNVKIDTIIPEFPVRVGEIYNN